MVQGNKNLPRRRYALLHKSTIYDEGSEKEIDTERDIYRGRERSRERDSEAERGRDC